MFYIVLQLPRPEAERRGWGGVLAYTLLQPTKPNHTPTRQQILRSSTDLGPKYFQILIRLVSVLKGARGVNFVLKGN